MNNKKKLWLDWKTKTIYLDQEEYCSWSEVEKIPGVIYCSHWDWPLIDLENNDKKLEVDEEKRIIKIGDGKTFIKEIWGGTKEKPLGGGGEARNLLLEIVPEFNQTHPSTKKSFVEAVKKWKWGQRWEEFGDADIAWDIDRVRCFTNIVRNYPLPCGKPQHITNPREIEQKLKEGKKGFVKFYLVNYARIKKRKGEEEIPFIPDYEPVIKGQKRLLLYTRLFEAFKKHYKIVGEIIYTDLWIFKEKKGCADKFLDYCFEQELKADSKEEKKKWKNMPNALCGILGMKNLGGYCYYPWHLAVIQTALLQNYYIYRLFKPENVLGIRGDAIIVKEKPPSEILEHPELYKVKILGVEKKETFNYENEELKSPLSGDLRKKSLEKWLTKKKELQKNKRLSLTRP